MKDDRLYLVHIRDCLAKIQNYTQDGSAEFMRSDVERLRRLLDVNGYYTKKIR